MKSNHVYVFQLVHNNDINHSGEDNVDVICVSGTSEMGVDCLGSLVLVEELLENEIGIFFEIRGRSLVIYKALGQRCALDLLLEQIHFVEKQDHGGFLHVGMKRETHTRVIMR